MPDAQVIANAIRQVELEKSHRDVTKVAPPIGTDGESLRSQRGFEGITDAMLEERANFNLREHMKTVAKSSLEPIRPQDNPVTVTLSEMTKEQLEDLANATLTEMGRRQMKEQG